MKAELLSRTDLLLLPEFTVILFVTIFVGTLVWMFRPGAKAQYEAMSKLPLEHSRATHSTSSPVDLTNS